MNTRYVVARHAFGGIGDHISCLIGAWWLAKRTGRTLVIDWRGSRFNADSSGKHNCFGDSFALPGDHLGGVPVIADDRVAELDYPLPLFPEKWSPAALASADHLKHTSIEVDTINQLVTGTEDRPEPTIVINQWVSPHPPRESVRELLEALVPVDDIAQEADAFWNQAVAGKPAIAIHVRHGNGENIGHRAAYWLGPWALVRQLWRNSQTNVHRKGLSGKFMDNMPESLVGTPGQRRNETKFYRRIAAEVLRMATLPGLEGSRPILFTDAPHVEKGLAAFLPNVVSCPKSQMAEGAGPLHQLTAASVELTEAGGIRSKGIQGKITHEMFVELELMRRCQGLVCMDSGFSIFSQRRLDDSRITLLRPTKVNRFIDRLANKFFR